MEMTLLSSLKQVDLWDLEASLKFYLKKKFGEYQTGLPGNQDPWNLSSIFSP